MLGRAKRFLWRTKAWWLFGHRRIHVYGNFTAVVPRNIRVGANVAINHGVFLLGHSGIAIGDGVVLSARCMLIDGALVRDDRPAVDRTHAGAPIVIEEGAWIGAGAIVLPGVTVGRNSVVGAGSVVTRDVAAGATVAGNPARRLGNPSG